MTENSKFLFGWSWTEVSVLGSQRKAVNLQLVKSPKKKGMEIVLIKAELNGKVDKAACRTAPATPGLSIIHKN